MVEENNFQKKIGNLSYNRFMELYKNYNSSEDFSEENSKILLKEYNLRQEAEMHSEYNLKESEKNFYNYIKQKDINVENIFLDKSSKIEALQIYGHRTLKIKGQKVNKGEKGLPLRSCEPERIGIVVKRIYKTIEGKLNNLKNINSLIN